MQLQARCSSSCASAGRQLRRSVCVVAGTQHVQRCSSVQQLQAAAAHRSQHCNLSQQRRGNVTVHSVATASVDAEEIVGPSALEPEVFEIVTYALKLAWTAETYNVHSWMVLLGLLKKESYTACQVLKDLGLEDLYGAWNEVLWALNAADGMEPRAFTPRIQWGERAALIVQGAVRFGMWAGRDKVATEDLLMAFAASDVLSSLFPDVDLSFDRVKHAVEKRTGVKYELPGYEGSALDSQDNFL
eukprot:GHUV01010879.1.p1 GENE.GHUV01010879.1~~GHUV01010879.1.p1  ORF type:complete len:244 (+),score=56.17 GHUV01010879.1:522-1253(+)